MKNMEDAFEKGIPSGIDVYFSFYEMLSLSDNCKQTNFALSSYVNNFFNDISKMIGKDISFYFSNRVLCVSTDLDTLEKGVTVHPDYFRMMLALCLNVNGIYNKMIRQTSKSSFCFGTKDEILEKIQLLKTIKSRKELKANFPGLDESWRNTKKFVKDLKQLKKDSYVDYQKVLNFHSITEDDIEVMSGFESLAVFINHTCEAFSRLVEFEDNIKDTIRKTRIGKDVFEHIPQEKLELFIASRFMEMAETIGDLDFKQKCLYYLSTYMFENKESLDDGLTVDVLIRNTNGKAVVDTFSKRDLYERFKEMLVNNPSLYNVNFDSHIFSDMSVDEINKLMADYMKSLKLKWEILDNNVDFYGGVLEKYQCGNNGGKIGSSASSTRDVVDVFMEKKEFFDSSDPYLKVVGKDTFDGYIGYIYPNGTVILDKFYEDVKTKRLAKNHAIYCMDIDDFYVYSQLSKSTIIANKLCKRFYHVGDWQGRVKKQITGCADLETGEKVKALELLNTLK